MVSLILNYRYHLLRNGFCFDVEEYKVGESRRLNGRVTAGQEKEMLIRGDYLVVDIVDANFKHLLVLLCAAENGPVLTLYCSDLMLEGSDHSSPRN